MISTRVVGNPMSGSTARPCDCCMKKRARWYCPADDAFLCHSCDGTVHSANSLARRHERVCLKVSSLRRPQHSNQLPSWDRGSTRKARTPRQGKSGLRVSKLKDCIGATPVQSHPTVPELSVEETTSSSQCDEVEDNQLLHYRVPVFDPFNEGSGGDEKPRVINSSPEGYQPSDVDVEEFATDVETLLGKGLDEESYEIENLGLLNNCGSNNNSIDFLKEVKAEDYELGSSSTIEGDDVAFRQSLDFSTTCEDREDRKVGFMDSLMQRDAGDYSNDLVFKFENDDEIIKDVRKTNKILLRLDYDAISEAWASQGSPWMNGQRPQINPDDYYWPHSMGSHHNPLYVVEHQMGGKRSNGLMDDAGRKARVSRYREKRRNRLFAKTIRYEVRKLNAEKRPRMKGRFVKRSCAPISSVVPPLSSK